MRLTFSLLGCLVLGCATQLPPQQYEAASTTIRAAEEVGATKVPQAALHLQMAKEQSEQAKKMAAQGNAQDAKYLLMRAEADAELALALARGDKQKKEAQQAVEEVKKLREAP